MTDSSSELRRARRAFVVWGIVAPLVMTAVAVGIQLSGGGGTRLARLAAALTAASRNLAGAPDHGGRLGTVAQPGHLAGLQLQPARPRRGRAHGRRMRRLGHPVRVAAAAQRIGLAGGLGSRLAERRRRVGLPADRRRRCSRHGHRRAPRYRLVGGVGRGRRHPRRHGAVPASASPGAPETHGPRPDALIGAGRTNDCH